MKQEWNPCVNKCGNMARRFVCFECKRKRKVNYTRQYNLNKKLSPHIKLESVGKLGKDGA